MIQISNPHESVTNTFVTNGNTTHTASCWQQPLLVPQEEHKQSVMDRKIYATFITIWQHANLKIVQLSRESITREELSQM